MEELPVIFRKHGGEITAYFPTVAWDNTGTIACYAHVGQHGGASTIWLSKGKRAKPEEYAELLAELRRIYEVDDEPVKLKVYQRAVGKANISNRR